MDDMDDSPTLPQLHRALRRLHWLVASLALLLVPMAATIAWLGHAGPYAYAHR